MVTDNIFTSSAADIAIEAQGEDGDGDDGGEMQAVDGDTMRKIMERAVKSRIYDKLDFMAGFFREGTVSHHMAKSKTRVVWFNDVSGRCQVLMLALLLCNSERFCRGFHAHGVALYRSFNDPKQP